MGDINSKYNNPCTKEHTSKHGFHFKSCDSCCNFIQCDEFGNSWEMPCPENTFWDQKALTCNHNDGQCNEQCGIPKYIPPKKYTTQKPQKHVYYGAPQEPQQPQQPQEPKYPVKDESEEQEPKFIPNPNECYNTLDRNPCTVDNINKGKLYWKSCSSCCNFIQCDVINIGYAYDMPCGEGTYWDQNAYTCNFNEGQCNEQCGNKYKY